jgi:hypothetical protein
MSLISYVKTATNKRLLISESYADSNQCTPCRGNLTSMPHAFHAQPAYGPDCMYLIWSVHSNLSLANDRAGSSSTRVGEQCDHGGGPVRGNGRCAGLRKKEKENGHSPRQQCHLRINSKIQTNKIRFDQKEAFPNSKNFK